MENSGDIGLNSEKNKYCVPLTWGPRPAEIFNDIITADEDFPRGGSDNAADGADEGRFPRAVGPEQRKNLPSANLQINILKRLKPLPPAPPGVNFHEVADGQNKILRLRVRSNHGWGLYYVCEGAARGWETKGN